MSEHHRTTALEALQESDRPLTVGAIRLVRYGGDLRFPEVGRQCVVYIGRRVQKNQFAASGTGFLVEIMRGDTPRYYLVTAHHVIDRLSKPNRFSIRLNHKDGTARELESHGTYRWWTHPKDESVDAAVYPWSLGTEDFPYSVFSTKRFVTPKIARERRIGVGDDVFVPGLFRKLAGLKRMMPMVRSGHIALMAEDRFETLNYGDALFHWIETFAIKGFSGSPVFVRETVGAPLDYKTEDDPRWLRGVGDLFLLGLVHGFLPAKVAEEMSGVSDTRQVWHTGISMVVPAHQILEILNQPKLVEYEVAAMNKGRPKKSGTDVETSVDDARAKRKNRDISIPPISRDKFVDSLKKVTRKLDKK